MFSIGTPLETNAQFVKNKYGGYLLFHEGFIYTTSKVINSYKNSSEWICEERLTDVQCSAQVNMDKSYQIDKIYTHNGHEPSKRFAAATIQKYHTNKDVLKTGSIWQERKQLFHEGFTYNIDRL